MNDWWAGLQPRERLLLIVAGTILAVLGVYLLILEPLVQQRDSLQTSVTAKRSELAWMREHAIEAAQLRQSQDRGRGIADRRSILAVVDNSIARAGLKPQLQRMEPDGQNAVKLWFKESAFDDLVRWLDDAEKRFGLDVGSLRIVPQGGSGMVDANISLKRESS